ncbi:MAG: glycosyltransferase [Fibrobacteria bacterium]|nr:glycosyltransferase [Fibrobacteria bacterium]
MVFNPLDILFGLYVVAAIGLFTYGINCYWLLSIFLRNKRKEVLYDKKAIRHYYRKHGYRNLPLVTTQLPIYNEANVVERLLKAVCAMEYPKDKHEIQLLDDSTDGTHKIASKIVEELRNEGYDIKHIRRTIRTDYKAGALNDGMQDCKGEFIAIFDADFVPPKDYLLKTVPFLLKDPEIGLVQARWGHLNPNQSPLTLSQSIGIDGHFIIEQSARSWGRLFMNFNGTAGIWRKTAIETAGGWQGDTLTEDMDLSYRAQIIGWKMKFVYDVVVPAELPSNINAFKSQQYRWAKGSIQTAMKLLPQVFMSKVPLRVKIQSFLHTTHYMIHPLMLITALLACPLLVFYPIKLGTWTFGILCFLILISSLAPSTLYLVAQKVSYIHWKKRIPAIPILMSVGVGIAFNNTLAVLSALSGNKGAFIRTPKAGDKTVVSYRTKSLPYGSIIELLLGIYCFAGLAVYIHAQKYLVGPFLGLYAIGFSVVGSVSIYQYYRGRIRASSPQ